MMEMPVNRFKQRLGTGEVQFGMFCGLVDPVASEICAGAGFDWVMVDVEHAPNDLRTVLHQLQATEPYDTSVIVRPQVGQTDVIKKLLDIGAQTLLVPMVESGDQAAEIVAACRYPPAGVRGVGTSLARAARWNRIDRYADRADAEICVVAQIESVEGVRNIESIAAVDGIDALFVGPSDLAASMGHIGKAGHPDVVAAVDESIRRIVAAGKPAGVFATTPESVQRGVDAGASVVAVGVDISMLVAATSALARQYRPAPPPPRLPRLRDR